MKNESWIKTKLPLKFAECYNMYGYVFLKAVALIQRSLQPLEIYPRGSF